jgi:hypothetical protein
MAIKEMLQQQIALSRMVIDGTIADCSQEMVSHVPGGIAHPIGALYAHSVMSDDGVVNGLLRKQTPLMAGEFAGKTGCDKPMPQFGEPGMNEWARSVKIDMKQLNEYAGAVRASVDKYIADLSDADLEQKVEFGGMGQQPIANILTLITIIHPSNHIGEVSALKGIAGAKGYPF